MNYTADDVQAAVMAAGVRDSLTDGGFDSVLQSLAEGADSAAEWEARKQQFLRGMEVLKEAKVHWGNRSVAPNIALMDMPADRVSPVVLFDAYFISAAAAYQAACLIPRISPSPLDYLTPLEAAVLSGTHESGWRNRAAAGAIPGAVKKGKQWLIPRAAIAE